MKIVFKKISNEEHVVKVFRRDNSTEEAILNSRSFLRHDFAHHLFKRADGHDIEETVYTEISIPIQKQRKGPQREQTNNRQHHILHEGVLPEKAYSLYG